MLHPNQTSCKHAINLTSDSLLEFIEHLFEMLKKCQHRFAGIIAEVVDVREPDRFQYFGNILQ